MYTLNRAREEIDAIAKHATDIAAHAITTAAEVEAKLDQFKLDILKVIDEKFAEFSRTLVGEATGVESTAIMDLGAKVSLLTRGAAAAPSAPDVSAPDAEGENEAEPQGHEPHHGEHHHGHEHPHEHHGDGHHGHQHW